MSEAQLIGLNVIGTLLDALFVRLYEADGYVIAKFDILQHVKMEFPVDSPEAQILKDRLTDDLQGQRVIICRVDDEEKFFRIAVKNPREER